MAKNRDVALDILKGIAILAMVIGHFDILVDLENNLPYKFIHRFIYTFHMPLFFIVAGYLYHGGGYFLANCLERL